MVWAVLPLQKSAAAWYGHDDANKLVASESQMKHKIFFTMSFLEIQQLAELLETERNYVNVLDIITKTFKPQLANSKVRRFSTPL